ncbi:MAG: 3-dehydroquinate synthase [Firmicutes bacterium]|nr:3-dehydroquinate synthase [Bacillota bacterium]
MKIVSVPAKRPYEIFIEYGCLDRAGEITARKRAEELLELESEEGALITAGKVCIVTDKDISSLYLEELRVSFRSGGFDVCNFVIDGGENSKTMSMAHSLAEFLGEMGFTASDLIVALGGGIVQDLAGFTAGFYLGGIDYVQIPTSVTAALSAGISGKAYVNLSEGKNLAVCSIDPFCVITDPGCFDTIPLDEYHAGFAEAVKIGIVSDRFMFESFELGSFDTVDVISKSLAAKARLLVHEDEKDFYELGESLASAVQIASGYDISHGDALAIGLYASAKAAGSVKLCDRIYRTLSITGLPVSCDIPKEEILAQLSLDKNIRGGIMKVVIPLRIGECEIREMTVEDAKAFFSKGLE